MADKRGRAVDADIAEAMAKLEKRFGKAVVGLASGEAVFDSYPRIETDVFAVDYLTGGGVPYGVGTLLWGDESGGKSWLCLKTIAGAQRMCWKCVVRMEPTEETTRRCRGCGSMGAEEKCATDGCGDPRTETVPKLKCPKCGGYNPIRSLYVDTEGVFQRRWAARQGVDTALVHVAQPATAENAGDIVMGLLETGHFGLVVTDSIAQMTPNTELVESMEKTQQGLQARLVNKVLRQFVTQMHSGGMELSKRVTFLFVNQVRQKIGVVFGSPDVKPGGRGQDFAAAIILKLNTRKYEKDEAKNTLNTVVYMKVEKNKTAPTARMESNFRLWLRDCVVDDEPKVVGWTDDDQVLAEYGVNHKAVERSGGKYTVLGKTVTSQAALRALIRDDYAVRMHLRRVLVAKPLGEVWYDLKEMEKARAQKDRM